MVTLNDGLFESAVECSENLGGGHFKVRLRFPETAVTPKPGQFVLLKMPPSRWPGLDPLLFRPFSVYSYRPGYIEVFYKVVGRFTRGLASLGPGEPVLLVGPLGNGFPPDLNRSGDLLILVAGGTGVAPLHFFAQSLVEGIVSGQDRSGRPVGQPLALLGGSSSAGIAAAAGDLRRLGVSVSVATEDGSLGLKGTVLDLLEECAEDLAKMANRASRPAARTEAEDGPARAAILAAGPPAVLTGASRVGQRFGWPVYVSMEQRMGCGVGVCRGCVVRRREERCNPGESRFVSVCSDGPVFSAEEVALEEGIPGPGARR